MRSGKFIEVDGRVYEIEETFNGDPAIYRCSSITTAGHAYTDPKLSFPMQLGEGCFVLVVKGPREQQKTE